MLKDKRVVAIIPARGGSVGVPGKNLRMVRGKSLLARTIESAQHSSIIDRIIVSSEDPNIIAAAKLAGAEVPFVRPIMLAQHDTPGSAPIVHALEQLPPFDYVVVLQVTSPLRETSDIDECLRKTFEKDAPACVSVTLAESSPYWMFTLEKQHTLKQVLPCAIPARRQDIPAAYVLNGAIYTAKTDWFMRKKGFLSNETIAYVMPKERSLDIDTEFDFELLELYLNRAEELH